MPFPALPKAVMGVCGFIMEESAAIEILGELNEVLLTFVDLSVKSCIDDAIVRVLSSRYIAGDMILGAVPDICGELLYLTESSRSFLDFWLSDIALRQHVLSMCSVMLTFDQI